jgi:hypothetical protein
MLSESSGILGTLMPNGVEGMTCVVAMTCAITLLLSANFRHEGVFGLILNRMASLATRSRSIRTPASHVHSHRVLDSTIDLGNIVGRMPVDSASWFLSHSSIQHGADISTALCADQTIDVT